MDMECNNITKLILPAIRINIAEQLGGRYKLNQKEIADILGVAQVAVSKYLNGNYSGSLKRTAGKIRASGIVDSMVINAARSEKPKEVERIVNDLCAKVINDKLVNLW